jgi:hypothetical protein
MVLLLKFGFTLDYDVRGKTVTPFSAIAKHNGMESWTVNGRATSLGVCRPLLLAPSTRLDRNS